MRFACWMTKVTNTHSEYVILVAFPLQSGCMKMPQFFVILLSPVLSKLKAVIPEYSAEEQTEVVN